jgi:hypothetical protein
MASSAHTGAAHYGHRAWLNHQPNPRESDELHRLINFDSVWLYMTANDQGGATVPTIYRYYLSHALKGNADIIQQLSKSPVLEGTGSI